MAPSDEPRFVDLRLPLSWLISASLATATFMITLGWQAAGQSGKLDTLISANNKLEKRLDDRDIRLDTLRDSIYLLQRSTDTNTLRITALESRAK